MSADEAPLPSDPRPVAASLGERLPWDVYEVYRCAWNAYRAHGLALAAASGVSWAALAWLEGAGNYVLGSVPNAPWIVVNGPDIFTTVVGACLHAGFLGIALAIAQGRRPNARDFFERAMRTGPTLFLLNLLLGSVFFPRNLHVFFLTYYLLPFDGVAFKLTCDIACMLALMSFALAPYYVVDAGWGPFATLRATWRASEGKRLHLILASMPVTAFAMGPLNIHFPGSWIIMELVIKPICAIALAIAFLRVTGRGALRDALPPPEGLGPVAYRGERFRL
jgi:hypothetical protein